jgi:2-desacetyl-2-hydroxyethyl bacteriochlorophyllide A dehydrogenase
MKAIEISAANEIRLSQRPEPAMQPGHVRLAIARIGYCGSDLNTFRGLNPLVEYPRVPGHEIAARVVEVAPDVPPDIRVGMDVTVLPYTACGQCSSCRWGRANACRNNQTLGVQRDGALTESIVIPWGNVVLAPGLSRAELALVEPLSVGFHAVARGGVEAGQTVVVLGSGMIGLGAIAGAGLGRGARVIAVDVDDAKLALARSAGAAEVINSRREDLAARVADLTQGLGPQVIIEAVGAVETFNAAVDLAAFAGRVIYIGYAKAPVTYQTKHFILKELDIRGSRNATREDFDRVIAMLQSRRYPVAATVTATVPFDDAPGAMVDWARDPARVTKIHVLLDR